MSERRTDLQTATLETTWGGVIIEAGSRGIRTCRLSPAPSHPPAFRVQRQRLPQKAHPALQRGVAFARAMLEGKPPGRCPAMDSSCGKESTSFRRDIWKAMRKIPRGETETYTELASRAGHPHAARAVGGACGANPLPLFVPCHRVVAAGGKVGGFSSGTAWKILLLNGEGVSL
jgi:methylated-DNA-[protein]-cysteine S-methyltransferase